MPAPRTGSRCAPRPRTGGCCQRSRMPSPRRDRDRVADCVASLIGRGPGLTPSGDDALVGLLASLHRLAAAAGGSGSAAAAGGSPRAAAAAGGSGSAAFSAGGSPRAAAAAGGSGSAAFSAEGSPGAAAAAGGSAADGSLAELLRPAVAEQLHRTGDISAHYLRLAVAGHFGERLIALCDALATGARAEVEAAAAAVVATGATSGADALLGVLGGVRLVAAATGARNPAVAA